MTAEERMRERAAQVCDEAHAFDANERGGKHGVAHGLASEIRALPLEGEQDQRAPIKYRAELIFDHETRIIHGTIDEPQGEPAEDQRGAAAIPTDTRAATVSDGAASKYRVEHDPSQSAPHHQRAERVKADARSVSQDDPASAHHSRTEQFEWVEIGFNARLDAEPAPAREPSAVEEVIQELREQYFCGTLVQRVERVIRQQQEELDRLRLQLISASEAEEDAKRLRAENAALREQLQGGVVVPRGGANALLEWSGAEPSQSVLSRAADDWINAS